MYTLVIAACFFTPIPAGTTMPEVNCVLVEQGEYSKPAACREQMTLQRLLLTKDRDDLALWEADCVVGI